MCVWLEREDEKTQESSKRLIAESSCVLVDVMAKSGVVVVKTSKCYARSKQSGEMRRRQELKPEV